MMRRTPLKRTRAPRVTEPGERPPERKRGGSAGKPRGVPAAVYREVAMRDGGCVLARAELAGFSGGCWGRLDPHHVWRRSQGGPDEAWNLVLLCRAHHSWVHDSGHGRTIGLLKSAPPKNL